MWFAFLNQYTKAQGIGGIYILSEYHGISTPAHTCLAATLSFAQSNFLSVVSKTNSSVFDLSKNGGETQLE